MKILAVLKSRFILNNIETTAAEAVHIYAEKAPVKIHNQLMLITLMSPLIVIKALVKLPEKNFIECKSISKYQKYETE